MATLEKRITHLEAALTKTTGRAALVLLGNDAQGERELIEAAGGRLEGLSTVIVFAGLVQEGRAELL